MFISSINSSDLVSEFRPVTLSDLNQRAAMLERLDQKYVVNADILAKALTPLSSAFSALEISGIRGFEYHTVYYDNQDRQSYLDHHQGRRRRAKVRLRHYVDAGLTYAEVKLKDRRGMTVKSRLAIPSGDLHTLPEDAAEFVQKHHRALYGRDLGYDLEPVLRVDYTRTTLVADQGGERLTIDSTLKFSERGVDLSINPDLYIVETKSANGNGLADKVFRSLHQHPVEHCSKYCVGTALLHGQMKSNRFRSAMRKLA